MKSAKACGRFNRITPLMSKTDLVEYKIVAAVGSLNGHSSAEASATG
jgi:hypothetical protein